ncbi:hypothetical protein BJY24_005019 [Nocardia transvalensis]|uniref:Uncharacterized protein n=1 Tax=Nocardia transvalensis TaxID=37333 RepID=A0A7W9PHD6_9NOCA|nr:hypothetical protein [Nocardia transvalensis]MBB5916107.1 hypothetical protein [Nocardia transvalensis]
MESLPTADSTATTRQRYLDPVLVVAGVLAVAGAAPMPTTGPCCPTRNGPAGRMRLSEVMGSTTSAMTQSRGAFITLAPFLTALLGHFLT